jgi:hypothetical protein
MTSDERREIDHAMLGSLSTWFRMRAAGYSGPHSFNDLDIAELLKRVDPVMTLALPQVDAARHHLRVAELLEANNRYLERARAAEAESARLKKILDACDWYWPADDTSSDASISGPYEALWDVPAGTVVAVSRGGVVETRYYAQLPPTEDADSDDEFEVDEATEEDAIRKVAEEFARRAARAARMPAEGRAALEQEGR